MSVSPRLSTCLWFDGQAEEAANYYVGIFKNSRIIEVTRFGQAGWEIHHRPAGSVMTVAFELNGMPFTALNGGPEFKFTEAISFEVHCKDQDEIDYYWERLGAGGDPKAQVCGWLKDRYGVSWQIVPEDILEIMGQPGTPEGERGMEAMLRMKKLDIAELKRARDG